MEDIFQIAIIVIFIVSSIISSLNKKKKAEQQAGNAKSKIPNPKVPNPISSDQKSSKNVLEELFGFKLEIPEPQQKEAPNNSYDNSTAYDNLDSYDQADSYDSTWSPEESYDVKNNEGRSDYASINLAKKEQLSSDKEKYQSFKKEETSKSNLFKPNRIKSIFADKSHLKDYVVIQDVLNKPKALRK